MDFKTALRAFMDEEQLSSEHVAAAARKSVFTVVRWLEGGEPKYGDVVRVCQAYPSFKRFLRNVAA